MIIGRLTKGVRERDWFAVVVELLVVIVGILAAFQVDRWWEDRGARLDEAMYVARLAADVEKDLSDVEYAISLANVRLDFADFLREVAADATQALDRPTYFIVAVNQAAFTYIPSIASQTYADMSATGNLKLIRDQDVRHALRDYYMYDEAQRQFQGLNLMVEFRHFELSAGILTAEQMRLVQDRWFVVNEEKLSQLQEVDPPGDEILAAAERLRENAELLAWLPRVSGLQIDQLNVLGLRKDRALTLLETLRTHANQIEQ